MSSPNERLASIATHLKVETAPKNTILNSKRDDDVVITLALRTPLTKAKKGYLKDTKLDDLLLPLLSVSGRFISAKCVSN
jgi:acetyl-CoA acyltransferase 1